MQHKTAKIVWKVLVVFVAVATILGLAMPFFQF